MISPNERINEDHSRHEEDTRHVNDAVENLTEAKQQAQAYLNNWVAGCVAQYAEQARLFNSKQQDYLTAKEQATIAKRLKITSSTVCWWRIKPIYSKSK